MNLRLLVQQKHKTALQAFEKNGLPIGWHCPSCNLAGNKSSTRTLCVICTKSIVGLAIPCLNCGHVTCFECYRKSSAREESNISRIDKVGPDLSEDVVEKSCPTGCDCICSSHQYVSAPYPPTSEDEEEQTHSNGAASRFPARALIASETADLTSTHGSDTAIGAFLSLSSRARSVSSSKTQMKHRLTIYPPQGKEEGENPLTKTYSDTRAKYANVGKGLGAELNRTATLRERGSDATIRRESEAEARLRRAGSFV